MKTIKIIFLSFALVTVSVLSFSITMNGFVKKAIPDEITTKVIVTNSDKYTVREYNGQIAVFENSKTVPTQILDTNIDYLPESDKKLLIKGIKAKSKAELKKIIEDYSS